MNTVLQIEFSPGLLEDRGAILRRYGCAVMSWDVMRLRHLT